jgi:hypothetical protein
MALSVYCLWVWMLCYVVISVILGRPSPILSHKWHVPTRTDIDQKLVVGSVLFAVGWALSGLCPGPGILALGTGSVLMWVWFGGLLAGKENHLHTYCVRALRLACWCVCLCCRHARVWLFGAVCAAGSCPQQVIGRLHCSQRKKKNTACVWLCS